MRELKFRAWHPEYKEMIYSSNSPFYDKREFYPICIPVGFSHYPDDDGWELMQYIDMQDKNGIEIYEMDIGQIKTESGRIDKFIVKWGIHRRHMASGWTVDIPSFCFFIDGVASFPIANNYQNGHDLDIIEIIGNYYENPELIESL